MADFLNGRTCFHFPSRCQSKRYIVSILKHVRQRLAFCTARWSCDAWWQRVIGADLLWTTRHAFSALYFKKFNFHCFNVYAFWKRNHFKASQTQGTKPRSCPRIHNCHHINQSSKWMGTLRPYSHQIWSAKEAKCKCPAFRNGKMTAIKNLKICDDRNVF